MSQYPAAIALAAELTYWLSSYCSDPTPVKVDERLGDDVFAELDVIDQAIWSLVRRSASQVEELLDCPHDGTESIVAEARVDG